MEQRKERKDENKKNVEHITEKKNINRKGGDFVYALPHTYFKSSISNLLISIM